MTILTLTENSNAHGTEHLLQMLSQQAPDGSRAAEIVYRLDADGLVDAHVVIHQDADGDYLADDDCYPTLDEAVADARAALASDRR